MPTGVATGLAPGPETAEDGRSVGYTDCPIADSETAMHRSAIAAALAASLLTVSPAFAAERAISKEATVPGPRAELWKAWTTTEGVTTFLAPSANVELAVGGAYEMYFVPAAPLGSRGSEGCRILAFVPDEMLAFSWNAPPQFPAVRNGPVKTWVVVRLEEAGPGATRVRLAHLGWQPGADWEQVYNYFDRAWDVVLKRLDQRFRQGPIDWQAVSRPASK